MQSEAGENGRQGDVRRNKKSSKCKNKAERFVYQKTMCNFATHFATMENFNL